jgi:ABC-type glutathione transport system ATPase component
MLEARGLAQYYSPIPAVRGLSFQLEPGGVLGLLGPNGSGKSTTVAILAGLLEPSGGAATTTAPRSRQPPRGPQRTAHHRVLHDDWDACGARDPRRTARELDRQALRACRPGRGDQKRQGGIGTLWPLYMAAFVTYAFTTARIEMFFMRQPRALLVFATLIGSIIAVLTAVRHRDLSALTSLRFEEDDPTTLFEGFHLSEALAARPPGHK